MFQHFVAIHVHKFLRHAGQKSGADAGDFRPFPRRIQKNAQVFGQELNIAAGTVFEDERESARSADTGNGRRGKTEGDRCG